MSEGKASPDRSTLDETSIDTLPESLQQQIRDDLNGKQPDLCAPVDLDRQGNYTDAYLVLGDGRLGHYVPSGEGWSASWTPLKKLSDARVVEGLGLSLLRLLRDGRVEKEFRYTMRHARAVAKVHRELERRLGKEDAEEEPATEASAAHLEEKKIRCETCGQVIPAWAEACPRCTSRRKILLRLLDYVKPYKRRAMVGFGLALSLTAVGLIQPALLKPLVNQGLGAAPGAEPHYPTVLRYVGIMAGLLLFSTVGRMLQMRLIFGLGTLVSRDIRSSVYRHLHKLSLSFFGKKQTGSLVTRVTSDVERIWRFIAFMFVDIIISILTIVGVGIGLFVINWRLAMYALMPVPLMFVLMIIFHRMLHRIFRRMWHRFSQMTAVIADALPGVRVIKAFGQERREVDRFEGRNDALMEQEMTFISSWTFFGPTMMFCSAIGGLIVWLLGGYWVVQGRTELGTLMAFTGYLGMFMRPIHMIAHMDEMLNRAATSAQRVFEILDTEPGIYSRSGAYRKDRLEGRIELRNVSFSYDGLRRVLKNVSLEIAPGEMIGLAGPSGGGKTTLVNLICRFYDVLEGQILIDGEDVRNYELGCLRRQIGVVLQEPFLFHGTVADNIAYGNAEANLESILRAARAANAHDFIVGFPDGYDTMVGERGQSLSGGERQRISIARAILNNPRVLILDEATSSVDTETEKLIQQALDRLIANRTTIAIAHRLSTLRKADRLVILEKGELVESGSHEQLAAMEDGIYAKLLRMQNEMQSVMVI
jgi:ATP-binding cassette, subfamily B, bacterial